MRVLRYGRRALLVECADPAEVSGLHADLLRLAESGGPPAWDDLVPAELTILIDGLDDLEAATEFLAAWRPGGAARDTGGLTRIAVRYDGVDLAEVARSWGVDADEAVRLHSGIEYRVAFCGFVPGFAYLTGLPERCHLPRRATPRTAVPAGSVAVAGPYTGVYPRSSPGGWHLIGTTDAPLWDLGRPDPALLVPGTRVRFEPREEPW
jgi:KipI family sensor histidine kinase inhibitor